MCILMWDVPLSTGSKPSRKLSSGVIVICGVISAFRQAIKSINVSQRCPLLWKWPLASLTLGLEPIRARSTYPPVRRGRGRHALGILACTFGAAVDLQTPNWPKRGPQLQAARLSHSSFVFNILFDQLDRLFICPEPPACRALAFSRVSWQSDAFLFCSDSAPLSAAHHLSFTSSDLYQ